jgi:hypothetical protein
MTHELGYVNPYVGSGQNLTDWMMWDLLEEVPELTYPLSLNVFGKMPRDDARVWSLLAAIRLPIRRTAYYIERNGARDEVVEHIATDFGLPIKGDNDADFGQQIRRRRKGRFSWQQHLRSAMTHLQYGHSVFEQVYALGDDGKLHLKKLAPRPQRTISKWNVAADGGLVSVVQSPPDGTMTVASLMAGGVEITVDRLVVYRHEPEDGVWIGTSLLRPAYKHWILKNELIRLEAVAVRRNGVGVPIVTAPDGIEATDTDAMRPYLELAKRYRGGNTAGVALPAGAIMKLLGVEGMRVDPRPAIDYHDKQIGIVALQQVFNLDGKGGSYALAEVQNDPYIQAVQAILDDLLDVTNEHVIEDLVDVNYSIDETAPLLVADDVGSKQDAQAAALNLLVQAQLLKPDPAIRAFIRQHLGAPPEDPEEQDEPLEDPEEDTAPSKKSAGPGRPSRRKPGPGQVPLW